MTKIRLDMESDDKVEKVIVDVIYADPKGGKITKSKSFSESGSNNSVSEQVVETKSHGFDKNMMDIVNG